MALSLKGELVKITPPKLNTVGDKNYASRLLVIEMGEEYLKNVAFEYDPDRKNFHNELTIGDIIEVNFSVISNESKKEPNSFFTKLTVFRVNVLQAKNPAPVQASMPLPEPAPTAQAPAQNAPAAAQEPKPSAVNQPSKAFDTKEEDDLPF